MKTVIFKYSRYSLPLAIICSSLFFLKDYFFPTFQILLALLVSPFIFRIHEPFQLSNRYFYLSLILFAGYYFLTMKILLFLGLGAFLFYSVESRFGKIGLLPFIFLICISPALHYVVTIFTFSLRLALSHYAADVLGTFGYPVVCNGNYFTMPDGFTFNVDKACLGLNMFNTGLSLTTLLIGLAEKKYKKRIPFIHLCGLFFTVSLLLVLANFLRIILIVLFRSMPGTASHEIIGILSMALYVAVPAYFLIRKLTRSFGKDEFEIVPATFKSNKRQIVFPAIAFAFAFFSFNQIQKNAGSIVRDLKLETLQLAGFVKEKKEDGVMEYRRDSTLIYIKPAVKPFEGDHPPALCWRGSGFDVEQVTELEIEGTRVLMAQIKKGKTIQYTAWWYDNGEIKTTDQFIWRLSGGEPFRIINITNSTREELIVNCKDFVKRKLF